LDAKSNYLRKAKARLDTTPGLIKKILLVLHWAAKVSERLVYYELLKEDKRIEDYYYKLSHDKEFAQEFLSDNLLTSIEKLPDTILDVGCGRGRIPAALSLVGKDVVAFDLARHKLWKETDKISFLVSDVTRIPFKDSSFELGTCLTVLEEVKDDQAALQEIHRVLKLNGQLILQVPNRDNLKFKLTGRKLYSRHLREYSSEQIRELVEKTGFRLKKLEARGFYSPVLTRFINDLISYDTWLSLGNLIPERYRGVISLVCEK